MRRSLPLLMLLTACQPPAGTAPAGPATPIVPAAAGFQEVALAAPPKDEGVQLVIGPFDVPAGSEVQKNFFLKLPAERDVAISRIQIAYPTGSHHCNLFKSDRVSQPDSVQDTFDAVPYDLFDMFAASQSGAMDWQLPENVVIRMKARQQLLVQTHYVNATTQKTPSGKGQVKINLWFARDASKAQNLGMLFAINKNLDIMPRATTREEKIVDLKRAGHDQDVKILAMTGHFHSRGKSFLINRLDGETAGEELYRSENWDEPPFKRYDPPVELKAGERLRYVSTFVNDSDRVIKFGPHVETEEHSNLFMYFYPGPADGRALYDVNGLP